MTDRDRELNALLAKKLKEDVAADKVIATYLEGRKSVDGAFQGMGGQSGGAGGFFKQAH